MSTLLHIAIDVRDLKIAATGTKTYLVELINALKKKPDCKIILLNSAWPTYWGHSLIGKTYEHISFFIWKQITLPVKTWISGANVLICTDYYVPLIKLHAKHIVVFHDALFFDHPAYYNSAWLKLFKNIAVPAAKKADLIVCPSQYSKDRIIHYLDFKEEKIKVIYQGAKTLHEEFYSDKLKGVFEMIDNSQYILHVGVLEKRKNIPFLIKNAASFLKEKNYKLILVGKQNPKINNNDLPEIKKTIEDLQLGHHVLLTGYLEDKELPYLYKHALAYILPSSYEGFGIPILEAFAFKLPVLVSSSTSLPEIGGDAVLIFEQFNADDFTAKLNTIASDQSIRKELVAKGVKRLEQFNWNTFASTYIETIKQITAN